MLKLSKRKKKWYEWNAFATKFTENCIGITITAQKCKDLRVTFSNQPVNYLEIKLWIMTMTKTKTKVIYGAVNSSKTEVFQIKS